MPAFKKKAKAMKLSTLLNIGAGLIVLCGVFTAGLVASQSFKPATETVKFTQLEIRSTTKASSEIETARQLNIRCKFEQWLQRTYSSVASFSINPECGG